MRVFRRHAASLLAVTLVSIAVFSPSWASAQTQTVPTSAAASDLKFALEEVAACSAFNSRWARA